MTKGGWVYILADRYRGGTYIGVAANLARRIWEHRNGIGSRHADRYGKLRLVHVEEYPTIEEAIAQEKAMKKMAACVGDRVGREGQPRLAGPV